MTGMYLSATSVAGISIQWNNFTHPHNKKKKKLLLWSDAVYFNPTLDVIFGLAWQQ